MTMVKQHGMCVCKARERLGSTMPFLPNLMERIYGGRRLLSPRKGSFPCQRCPQ